jgi:hypothetical protein
MTPVVPHIQSVFAWNGALSRRCNAGALIECRQYPLGFLRKVSRRGPLLRIAFELTYKLQKNNSQKIVSMYRLTTVANGTNRLRVI